MQNYPNRELVISYPKNDTASKELVQTISKIAHLNMLVIEREETLSIGSARNQAIEYCNGDYICTWDDDDWYRDVRLMYQYTVLNALKKKCEASIITTVLLYKNPDQVYYSDSESWAGTLLCKKEIVQQFPYRDRDVGEERDLFEYLNRSNYAYYFSNNNLYAFIYHGGNLYKEEQFNDLCKERTLVDEKDKNWLTSQINRDTILLS